MLILFKADPNDWVNIDYVLKHAGRGASGDTATAQSTIGSSAVSTARQGPWSE